MAAQSNREETISLILSMLLNIDSEAYEDDDLASSSLSEDENELREVGRLSEKTLKVEGYVEEIVSRFSPQTFKSHFRMTPETVNAVENMISEKLINNCSRGRQTLEPRKQILMALWLTPESYRSVSDRFDVSKATLWFTSKKVWEAISSLSGQFIRFPSGDELETNASQFKKACGFPGVIGCIDGSHIPIKAPINHPESYINRKGFHSVLLQAVMDSRFVNHSFCFSLNLDFEVNFIDLYAGEVGSVHDARVFRCSKLGRSLSTLVPPKYHLLGDSAYPLQEQLITPFRDNGHLSPQQLNFNLKHSRTRNIVE
ncbi:putative nuclease HARBI1 [Centruroides vittatus]|uniref:putative nuclease HARBI1 n=1 Tax=Centruroides vittatus TaxID=120091 RepID=UPI003510A1F5